MNARLLTDTVPRRGRAPTLAHCLRLPSTEAQREIWLAAAHGEAASCAFNLGIALDFDGPLDVAALRTALNTLVARHESLRACFAADGTELVIAAAAELELPVQDLRALSEARREHRREQAERAQVATPFDFERAPLLRAELLLLGSERASLLLAVHHAVCDGYSLSLLLDELGAAYAAARGRADPPLPPAESFAEFAEQAAQQPMDAAIEYWRQRFSSPPRPLDLPLDRPRPAERSYRSGRVEHGLDGAAVERLRRIAARRGSSLSTALLTVWTALLARIAGSDELVVAMPAAGQLLAGREQLVGHCTNLLPLRLEVTAGDSFRSLLERTQARVFDAFDQQSLTLSGLLRRLPLPRDPARPALAAVTFNLDRAVESLDFPDLRTGYRLLPRPYDNFELSLNAVLGSDGVRLECQYAAALFEPLTVGHWLAAFGQLLAEVVEAPDAELSTLPLVLGDTLAELRALQPDRAPVSALLPDLLDAAAERFAERPAVRDRDRRLDYASFAAASRRLAARLAARGIGPGSRVALLLPRGVDLVVAAAAVLRTGAAYLPLDPAHPRARIDWLLADAGAALLLSDRATLADATPGLPTLRLDDRDDDASAADDAACDWRAGADPAQTPAYLIHTSGSTGTPKAVAVPHAAVANLLAAMRRAPGITADDRQLAVASPAFDMAVQDIWLPLTSGAELVLADVDAARDAGALARLIDQARITIMEATPTHWRLLADAGFVPPAGFRALAGGEPLPMPLAERLAARGAEVWNMYGPTETTVHATAWRVQPRAAGMALGRPIDGVRVWVLDRHGAPCPLGVPGELCIAGAGVALGYLHGDDAAFVREPDGLSPQPAPMYRTGDLGRWCADGLLEHLGRIDRQVKLRGFRIEPGEIEARLCTLPGIREAVVQKRALDEGEALVAWLVADREADCRRATLRQALARWLPSYMIPAEFIRIERLPCTVNGKLDVAALPPPSSPTVAPPAADDSPLEALLRRLWQQLLGSREFGRHDSFFELGGHSLLAVRLFHELQRATGVDLPLATLYRAPTLAGLAAEFAAAGAEVDAAAEQRWRPLVAIRPCDGRADRRPLFLIHSVGGNVINYRRLAERLPGELPVYGLQSLGLDGATPPLQSIEDMAACYVDELRSVQPHGPYRLGGGSMGGVIAFEMARLLAADGETVERLLLFDTDLREPLARAEHGEPGWGERLQRLRADRGRDLLARIGQRVGSESGRILDVARARVYQTIGKPLPHAMRYRQVEEVNHRAYLDYRPGPYDGEATLFLATDEPDHDPDDPSLGWRQVLGERLRIVPIPGTHNTLIEQPELARRLADELGEPERPA